MKVYKYCSEEYADKWGGNKICLRPIKYFREIEDPTRQDELENRGVIPGHKVSVFFDDNKIEASSFEFSYEDSNLFVACFSLESDNSELKKQFGGVVFEYDTSCVNESNIYSPRQIADIKMGKVKYIPENEILKLTPFNKRIGFKHEKEFRIAIWFNKEFIKDFCRQNFNRDLEKQDIITLELPGC